mgnify:CR=1 FL=1
MAETESHGAILEIDVFQLREKFKQAEKAIKIIEVYHDDLVIPSVNQLRYAGFHLTKYLVNPDDQTQLHKAAFHCERANYDALETGLTYLAEQFVTFKEDFCDVQIGPHLPEFRNYKKEFREIQAFVIEHSNTEERQNHIDECYEHYMRLKEIVEDMDLSRDDLNKEKEKERRSSRRFQLGAMIATATLVVAIIAVIVTIIISP